MWIHRSASVVGWTPDLGSAAEAVSKVAVVGYLGSRVRVAGRDGDAALLFRRQKGWFAKWVCGTLFVGGDVLKYIGYCPCGV